MVADAFFSQLSKLSAELWKQLLDCLQTKQWPQEVIFNLTYKAVVDMSQDRVFLLGEQSDAGRENRVYDAVVSSFFFP